MSILLVPAAFAQRPQTPEEMQEASQRAEYQAKLQQILDDRAGYVANIVRRWEREAMASGRWEATYQADLTAALMKLTPDNLLAAGEASSFREVMRVLETGRRMKSTLVDRQDAGTLSGLLSQPISPNALGDVADDLVYTPITPCRIVDTRNAGGIISAGTSRNFDVDNTTSFAFQGGYDGPCGIPYSVAQAVAMTITVVSPSGYGYFTAWRLGGPMPLASVLNFAPSQIVANTTIVPVWPGPGSDMSLYSAVSAHAVIDVIGYYAAPVATALDCTVVSSAVTDCPYNTWTAVDANCPAGRTATGGGYSTPEGSLGYAGVWLFTYPNAGSNGWRTWVDNQNSNGSRRIQTWVTCCRIPGR